MYLRPSAVHIELLSSPYSFLPSPAARHSPLTCVALPALDRPPIPGAADRVRVLMRRAWVGKWCAVVAVLWLLKYIINVTLYRKARKRRKVKVTMSLRTLRSLR